VIGVFAAESRYHVLETDAPFSVKESCESVMTSPRRIRQLAVIWRFIAISGLLAAITALCFRVAHVNATTAGFAYLIAILFTAARWGLVESTFASIVAVVGFNFFFFAPIGTLTIVDPQNWIALLAFLATSVTASQLSTAVRKQRNEAMDRTREIEQLYSFSRAILLLNPATRASQQLAVQIARVFESDAVILFDKEANRMFEAGPEDLPGLHDVLREAASKGTEIRDEQRNVTVAAIRLGAEPIGSLALRKVRISDSALQGLVNLTAIGIERARAQEKAGRTEAARQSDELKSTLLDAIAHDFKTPLTSIKAASSSLLSADSMTPEQSYDLVKVVDEEADRLSSLVTDAIEMARLQPGRILLNRRLCAPSEIVRAAAAALARPLEERNFLTDVPEDLPFVEADRDLLRIVLRQLLDNALKYSPPVEPIGMNARQEGSAMVFRVENSGPGIPENETSKIFERFYRSSATKQSVPGAGLGLAIAKDIVEAHGGRMWVERASQGGSVFCVAIPLIGGRGR
jgi:two-component system sensor histidine kinase KdpD